MEMQKHFYDGTSMAPKTDKEKELDIMTEKIFKLLRLQVTGYIHVHSENGRIIVEIRHGSIRFKYTSYYIWESLPENYDTDIFSQIFVGDIMTKYRKHINNVFFNGYPGGKHDHRTNA